MADLPVDRMRLLNVSSAHAKIDAACKLLAEAVALLVGERRSGLPVEVVQTRDAHRESEVAREQLWLFLKRMP